MLDVSDLDPCSRLFSKNSKSICVCRLLQSLGTSTPDDLARRCVASRSTVLRVIHRLEEERLAQRIYYNDVDYTVVWSAVLSLSKKPRKW